MAEVDRRLRGKGFPDNVGVRSVERQIKSLSEFIGAHTASELAMWRPKSKAEEWYERNKFWVWLVGMIVTGLLAKLL
jgi:hypothetical protein